MPQARRNQPFAGDGCREDANPVSYIRCMPQDGSVRARRGPCTCPSIAALETLLPAAVRGSPCSRVPGCPLAGLGSSGMQAPARAGAGRIGSK